MIHQIEALKMKFLIYFFLILTSFTEILAEDLVRKRIIEEGSSADRKFTLTSHRQNYLLPLTYNFSPNNSPNEDLKSKGIDTGLDRVMRFEAKFQLSFKFSIAKSLFTENDRLWAAYTQQSYWQVYNQNSSRPFRENNYEPELIYVNPLEVSFGNFKLDGLGFGFVHQSNGQTANLSRSWNRAYLHFLANYKDTWGFVFRPWYRFSDGVKDDNPSLTDYMGFFDLRIIKKIERYTMQLLIRNSLKDEMKGFREFSFSFPLDLKIKGLIQYSNGYGESLLDYKAHTNRIGIGLVISEIL